MATKKRSGLGRGLSALIPQAPAQSERDIDVFFNGSAPTGRTVSTAETDTASTTTNAAPARTKSTGAKAKSTKTASSRTASASKSTAKKAASTAKSTKSAAKSATTSRATAKKTSEPSIEELRNASMQADEAIERIDNDRSDDAVESTDSTSTEETTTAAAVTDTASLETASTAATAGDSAATDTAASDDEMELLPVPGARLAELDPYRIVPNAKQPRHEFDQDALDELIISVREFGVLQPIVVRPLAEDDPRRAEGDFELIMGERRLRATKASGRTEVPAIIRDTNDEDMLRDALLENLHRAELNPLEEASAYRQLLDDFGCTQDELAERIGRSRPQISNTLRLLNLPVEVQRRVAAGVLSAGHARAVLSVGEPIAMAQLADKIVNEQLSVRQAEAAAATSATRAGRANPRRGEQHSDSLTAHLNEVGERLGDRLNTRVQVSLRKTKGTIRIDFASVADLNRILEELGEDTEV